MGNVKRDESGRLASIILAYVYTGLKNAWTYRYYYFLVNKTGGTDKTNVFCDKGRILSVAFWTNFYGQSINKRQNVSLLNSSSKGHATPVISHLVDSVASSLRWPCFFRRLYLRCFNPDHILKNIRNKFVDH